jgi:20S proteasome subunit alpha 2
LTQEIVTEIYRLRHLFYHYRYSDNLELEDAIHTAILTLKESFEGQMTEDNIEIGICNKEGFRRLTPPEVKDYLASVFL